MFNHKTALILPIFLVFRADAQNGPVVVSNRLTYYLRKMHYNVTLLQRKVGKDQKELFDLSKRFQSFEKKFKPGRVTNVQRSDNQGGNQGDNTQSNTQGGDTQGRITQGGNTQRGNIQGGYLLRNNKANNFPINSYQKGDNQGQA